MEGRPQGGGRPVGDEPEPSPATPSRSGGRTQFGSGFRPSQVTPLVIRGIMYVTTPYSRVAAIDPVDGAELWSWQLPSGNPSTRGLEYWPGDGKTPAQVVFGSSDGKLYSLDAKTGKPNPAFGDNGVVNLNTDAIMRGHARPKRNDFASHRVQESRDHGRHNTGEPAAGTRGRRARMGHANRQARVDLPLDPRAGRKVQRYLGRRQLEEPLWCKCVGISHSG